MSSKPGGVFPGFLDTMSEWQHTKLCWSLLPSNQANIQFCPLIAPTQVGTCSLAKKLDTLNFELVTSCFIVSALEVVGQ